MFLTFLGVLVGSQNNEFAASSSSTYWLLAQKRSPCNHTRVPRSVTLLKQACSKPSIRIHSVLSCPASDGVSDSGRGTRSGALWLYELFHDRLSVSHSVRIAPRSELEWDRFHTRSCPVPLIPRRWTRSRNLLLLQPTTATWPAAEVASERPLRCQYVDVKVRHRAVRLSYIPIGANSVACNLVFGSPSSSPPRVFWYQCSSRPLPSCNSIVRLWPGC